MGLLMVISDSAGPRATVYSDWWWLQKEAPGPPKLVSTSGLGCMKAEAFKQREQRTKGYKQQDERHFPRPGAGKRPGLIEK